MGNVSNLSQGQEFNSFKVISKAAKETLPDTASFAEHYEHQQNQKEVLGEINDIRRTFQDRYAENGEVEILVESDEGAAVIQSKNGAISIPELAEQGGALSHYAIVLRDYDENKDGVIVEDELYRSWGERFGSAAGNVGIATVSGAGTGATIGAMGGTAVVPGVGTVAGGGALGLLGGAIGAIGSTVFEGAKLAWHGATAEDNYDSPDWIR